MDSLRNTLDELFGRDRNAIGKDRTKKKEHYSDPDVCKYFLVSLCPHDLFPNTKCDLGVCNKRHDDFFKMMFEAETSLEKLRNERKYITDSLRIIESLLATVDTKTKQSRSRLEGNVPASETPKEILEKIELIDKEIQNKLAEIEHLSNEGRIEETEAIYPEVEKLKLKKEELMQIGDGTNLINNKLMKVCDVCGALQAINDTERRMQTHLEGKLHTGFAILRKEHANLKNRKDKVNRAIDEAEKEEAEKKAGAARKRSRSRTKRSRSRSKNRDRERERERDNHRERDRDRDRSGSRKKSKKHHRDRGSPSRSRSDDRGRKDKRRKDDRRNHH